MFGSLGYILKLFSEPDFKIENPMVKQENIGKQVIKHLSLQIKNKGKTKAEDCKVKIKIKDCEGEFCHIIPPYLGGAECLNINSGDKITILICQVPKNFSNVALLTVIDQPFVLSKGEKYLLEIRITGGNFSEKKVSNVELDLLSWENIGIKLV